ncbi:MAG TPA: radical SAM protein [Vicinamibacteria bacterium]|nr:radical SAM protein [Vicinamibacteria bacterium]
MQVHLVNPSNASFGIGVITPRWLFVLAAATPKHYGTPRIVDETLEQLDSSTIEKGDVVGIGIHTGNALRGYEVGRMARERGAFVIYGGIHATLYPEESFDLGQAHGVVKGDGDVVWAKVLAQCAAGEPDRVYEAGRIAADQFKPARWELLSARDYMWASVQTVRGCPKHCSFCSVWRTDGQKPRQRASDVVIQEIVELRRLGFRFIALADDNFYPVALNDLRLAERRGDRARLQELKSLRDERFELMAGMTKLPPDMVFFTQITMEAAEDPAFLDAMRNANIKGALVGIESVTPEGLKVVHKDFNASGPELIKRLRTFRKHGVHVLGSFIFGLPTDRPETFDATAQLAQEADLTFAQFVMMTPFPGTVDFHTWEKSMADDPTRIGGFPLTRHWLIPQELRPKIYTHHPELSSEEIRSRTQAAWNRFYRLGSVWKRSRCTPTLRSRLAFVLLSKLYRQMYANTGIATDSACVQRATTLARWIAKPAARLFRAKPLPDLQAPASRDDDASVVSGRSVDC